MENSTEHFINTGSPMEEYEELKTDNRLLKQKLENSNQELHESKRNVKVLQAVHVEYQNEIDMLQSDGIRQKQTYQEIIKQLEQTINNMRDSHYDEKQAFENVITKMEEKNEQMRTELAVYKGSYNNTTNFVGDTSSLINDILSETADFYETQELKNSLKELQDKNEILERRVGEYMNEIDNLKESFKCTRNDLLEANSTIQFLNDEILCLKGEIDSLKNQPLNTDSKGNSLFAEVDDRRVHLQDKVNKMTATYIAMTQEKAQLQNSVHHLKLENMRLLEKWKSDIEERDDDNHEVLVALRSRIDVLEELIKKYKNELSEKPVVISKRSFEEIEFYSLTLTRKNQEMEDLKDKMSAKSLDRFLLASGLKEANEEKRKWRLEAMSKQHELELLQSEIALNSKEKESDKNPNKENSTPCLRKASKKEKNVIKKEKVDKQSCEVSSERRRSLQERLSDIQEEYLDPENHNKNNTNIKTQYIPDPMFAALGETSATEDLYVEHINNVSNKRRESILIEKDESVSADKENVSENKDLIVHETKKVSFAEHTLSPKNTGRRGGRRAILPKPIFITD